MWYSKSHTQYNSKLKQLNGTQELYWPKKKRKHQKDINLYVLKQNAKTTRNIRSMFQKYMRNVSESHRDAFAAYRVYVGQCNMFVST